MPSRIALLAVTQILALTLLSQTARADSYRVAVRITGAEPATGVVEVSLFNTAENFLKATYMQQSGPVDDKGEYRTVFTGVPEGSYAVVVAHDANENQKLDNGLFGFGGERYGYSNDVRPLFGRPSFEDAAFEVTENTTIHVELK